MRNVQSRAGQFRKLHIARHANGFRRCWHSAQTESRGSYAFAHHCAVSQRGVLRMFNHRKIQRATIIHHQPRQTCGGDRFAVVGNGHDAGFFHCRNFGHRFALASHAGCADRPHPCCANHPCFVYDVSRDRRIVMHRFRIGHAANRCKAAARGGLCAGFNRLRRFLSRLAQVHVKIDESRRHNHSRSVKNFSVFHRRKFAGR